MEDWIRYVPGLRLWLRLSDTQYLYVKRGIGVFAGVVLIRFMAPLVVSDSRTLADSDGQGSTALCMRLRPWSESSWVCRCYSR